MTPEDKQVLFLSFSCSIIFFATGIFFLFVGGSIDYLDCSRQDQQVDCVITTRFLGTFATKRREAIDVLSVVQAKYREQDDWRFRVQLRTSSGRRVTLSDKSSPDRLAAQIAQISAYLEDTNRQALQIRIVFWGDLVISLVLSAVFILPGALGLAFSARVYSSCRKESLILPGEGEAHERPDRLPLPDHLRAERDVDGLRFGYRYTSWKRGLFGLVAGLAFLGMGAFMGIGWLLVGGSDGEGVKGQGFPAVEATLIVCGVFITYLALVSLVDRVTIQVTRYELRVRFVPLPHFFNRRLYTNEIQQLYVTETETRTRWGWVTFFALRAVLRNGRSVGVVPDLPYDVLRYLEIQIESYLGLKDRRVVGEVDTSGVTD